ncbi:MULTISPECIES: hypothetical protein [Amycolatopsis]|uniref:Uncharacterized protein n=1 Tax=Amycolatopsis albidoflavus TaxID=102226 RepID=A0ABW5HTV4_9PSEU
MSALRLRRCFAAALLPDAAAAIAELRLFGLRTVILAGDNTADVASLDVMIAESCLSTKLRYWLA